MEDAQRTNIQGAEKGPSRDLVSALGKWGRTQMGSDGFSRSLLFQPCQGAPRSSENTSCHDFKGFRPDFNRILTGLQRNFMDPWNPVKTWLKTVWPPPRLTPGSRHKAMPPNSCDFLRSGLGLPTHHFRLSLQYTAALQAVALRKCNATRELHCAP